MLFNNNIAMFLDVGIVANNLNLKQDIRYGEYPVQLRRQNVIF